MKKKTKKKLIKLGRLLSPPVRLGMITDADSVEKKLQSVRKWSNQMIAASDPVDEVGQIGALQNVRSSIDGALDALYKMTGRQYAPPDDPLIPQSTGTQADIDPGFTLSRKKRHQELEDPDTTDEQQGVHKLSEEHRRAALAMGITDPKMLSAIAESMASRKDMVTPAVQQLRATKRAATRAETDDEPTTGGADDLTDERLRLARAMGLSDAQRKLIAHQLRAKGHRA